MIHFRTLGAVDLRDEHGDELRLALAQPKRLALLAYLAIATPAGFHRRDTMLSLFWPEMDQERARRALRQAVHFLRSTLGADVVQTRGGEDIGLTSDALWCDARAFDDALARGALAEALELYRGDLLDGFYISDASSDFEEWLEKERVRLRQRATAAAWTLSDQSAAAGRSAEAAERARWAAARAPDDERAQRRLMTLLDRQGDRTGALRVYEQLAQRAQSEFESEPSAESRALVASIRARDTVSATPMAEERSVVVAPPVAAPAVAADIGIVAAPPPPRTLRWLAAAAIAIIVVAGIGYAFRAGNAKSPFASTGASESTARPHGAASSPVASGFFDAGLRALYDKGDARLARSLFLDALNADTTLAMAAYYVAMCDNETNASDASEMMSRAMRLASTARTRERLIISTQWAMMVDDPERMIVAESLATLYPGEPEGHIALASVLARTGDFLGAVPHLRHVISADSLPHAHGAPPFCASCIASEQLVSTYLLADSLPAAELVARQWCSRKPQSIAAWSSLRDVLAREGRESDADEVERELVSLDPGTDADFSAAVIAVHADQLAEADHLLSQRVQYGGTDAQGSALWWMVIVRRNQGRLDDALTLAHRLASLRTPPPQTAAIAEAQIEFEQGRFSDAANLFESLAALPPLPSPIEPGSVARHRSWFLTHAGTAWASAGDTTRLAQLADEVEGSARLSAYGRDWKLPHYLRGLLWNARGDHVQALREFQRAIWSPTDGFTRANLELARASIAAGRLAEATTLLQAALRGPIEASNFYVTRTVLHELLAHTFMSLDATDSAVAHFDIVARSWQYGDAPFRARAAQAASESSRLRHAGARGRESQVGVAR
ncbi:MAG: BTAD domain-containing putative transcriptional regulator [Gemmatimonadaceae bacterium]